MGHEARYSVPEKLPDALFALVDQLDDLQEQECWASFVVSNVALQRLRIYFKIKRRNWQPGMAGSRRREKEARLNSHFFFVL